MACELKMFDFILITSLNNYWCQLTYDIIRTYDDTKLENQFLIVFNVLGQNEIFEPIFDFYFNHVFNKIRYLLNMLNNLTLWKFKWWNKIHIICKCD